MENSLYAYFLEIQNKGDSLKITSTSCQEIYFRVLIIFFLKFLILLNRSMKKITGTTFTPSKESQYF